MGEMKMDAVCENCGAPCEYDSDVCLCMVCLLESKRRTGEDRVFGGRLYTPTDKGHLTADYVLIDGQYYIPLE